MRILLFLAVGVIAAMATSCNRSQSDSEVDLYNGIQFDKSEYPSVVWLGGCTATTVSDNTVVFAAHCVGGSSRSQVSVIDSNKKTLARSQRVLVHPKYGGGYYRNMTYDVAVAIFPNNSFNYEQASSVRRKAPRKGDAAVLFGYAGKPTPLKSNTKINSINRQEIVTRVSDGAVAQRGDSGGPMFVDDQLVGVASRADGSFTQASFHTNLQQKENMNFLESSIRYGAFIKGLHEIELRKPEKDGDGDGVQNQYDLCPSTPEGQRVWTWEQSQKWSGCAERQIPIRLATNQDADGDGIHDFEDRCPNTPSGKNVWLEQQNGKFRGCAEGQRPFK